MVLADANAHNIVVQQDGVTVATYDASYGSGDDIGDPNRVTRSGVHVVMDKQETTKMSNPAYGYTNITEHWAVRISDNGEFIHQNQDTVDDQGVDQRQPRLHQPVRGERRGVLQQRDLRRPGRGDRHQRAAVRGRRRHLRLGVLVGRLAGASRPERGRLPADRSARTRCRRAARLFHAAAVAQSAERLTRNEKVWGSIPHSGSAKRPPILVDRGPFATVHRVSPVCTDYFVYPWGSTASS